MEEARPTHTPAIQDPPNRTPRDAASGLGSIAWHPNRYKIKLRALGYRLVYEVRDQEVLVVIVAVGRRDGNAVYLSAEGRDSAAH